MPRLYPRAEQTSRHPKLRRLQTEFSIYGPFRFVCTDGRNCLRNLWDIYNFLWSRGISAFNSPFSGGLLAKLSANGRKGAVGGARGMSNMWGKNDFNICSEVGM